MLHHQMNHPLTRFESTQFEPVASTDEQVKGPEAKVVHHDKNSSATPKNLNASVAGSYGNADISPVSTLGTTVSSGDSVPVTPFQVRLIKGKKKPYTCHCNKRDKMHGRKESLQTL